MSTLGPDQQPDEWSRGAHGYADRFAVFTALYAGPALDLLDVATGTTVLDVACGSGVVTAAALDRGATVVATDFAEGMVRELVGRRRRADGPVPPAAVTDACHLAVVDGAVDVAVSMFGVMFAPDPVAGIAEMARAVRSGGRVGIGTWDLEGFHLSRLVGEAVQRTVPAAGERPAPTWAALGTAEGLGAALGRAGLTEVEVHRVSRHWSFDDAEGFFRDGPTWSPPMRPLFEALPAELHDRAARHFAEVVAEADDGSGIPNDALVAVGTAVG